jgi:hypothetical protein
VIKFLGSVTLRDCSLVRATTSWWCKLPFDYFLVVQASVPLLSEGYSWDDTASILPASNYIDYFKLLNMSTIENGTTGSSGTGPASGYNLVLSHLFIVLFLFLYRLRANTSNPYTVIMLLIFTHSMIYFMIFGIKICRKMQEHRGMVIHYLQFFQSVIHLSDGLISVLISMCVLIYPCFHLIRSEGLDPY